MSEPNRRLPSGLAHAPIFFSFFTWGFGTGAQNLGRPLFAFAVTGNVFLVGVLLASNAIPRMLTGPMTGFLADRLGRKPLVLMGPTIRGLSNIGQFFADDYVTFFVYEIIGQVGVAMWATSSNVLLSDVTNVASRGRVLALRQMATRLGFIAGPAVGGVSAALFGLESIFLINGISKVVIVVVVLVMVKETRPEEARRVAPGTRRPPFTLAPFKDRAFLVVAICTAVFAMSNAGLMQTLVPVHAVGAFELDTAATGFLISLASGITFLLAFPNGLLADRFGRKWSLGPGLLLMAAASLALIVGDSYEMLLGAVALIGAGEAMAMGTTQTYAMDLAPPDRRGMFLGLATLSQSVGATAGPVLLAGLYHFLFPNSAFITMAILLLLASVLLVVMGRETGGRKRLSAQPPDA